MKYASRQNYEQNLFNLLVMKNKPELNLKAVESLQADS